MIRRRLAAWGLAALVAAAAGGVRAEDMPVFKIDMNNGKITPSRLEVPAKTRFKLEITNSGDTPAEFESIPLKREKVLAAGSSANLVIRTLDAGEYTFFDDFHPGSEAVLVAK